MRLDRDQTLLLVIDVQEKMMPPIDGGEALLRNVERLVRGAHVLGLPTLVTEQYVRGLGPTVEPLRRALEETSGYAPVEKICFSAAGSAAFVERLRATGRKQIVIAGVETHVCVYQTATDLIAAGFDVTLAADAVGSRAAANRTVAIDRMSAEGARLSSTEMALFELLVTAGTDEFRAISRLVR